jgi:hypothetical protein
MFKISFAFFCSADSALFFSVFIFCNKSDDIVLTSAFKAYVVKEEFILSIFCLFISILF